MQFEKPKNILPLERTVYRKKCCNTSQKDLMHAVLLQLYNRVWSEGKVPQAWRHSIVMPVLKPGKDPHNVSSYRPISLTNTIGKVMEKLVTNRLSYHVEKNGLLTNVQSGFRRGRSTVDQIFWKSVGDDDDVPVFSDSGSGRGID